MTTGLLHALEIHAGSATLYLAGRLSGSDAFVLRRVCREIPEHVTTLRVDLHAVSALDASAMSTVRSLVRFWRESRRGGFRLSFASEHLIARYVDGGSSPAERPSDLIGSRKAALTGMFL